jgi:TetR/AcrR family transcriptional regulator, transcriptional repressor for nem operon
MARPREFDPSEALEKVTRVFWKQGYQATSYRDLMKATRLSKQSLYCAFGDKHELFLKSLRHYREQTADALERLDRNQKTASELLREMMTYAAFRSDLIQCPQGCLVANTTLELGSADPDILRELLAMNDLLLRNFSAVLLEGQKKHQVTDAISSKTLARFLLNTLNGIRILEKTARSKDEIQSVIDVALRSVL